MPVPTARGTVAYHAVAPGALARRPCELAGWLREASRVKYVCVTFAGCRRAAAARIAPVERPRSRGSAPPKRQRNWPPVGGAGAKLKAMTLQGLTRSR